jgi:hypothetical protein
MRLWKVLLVLAGVAGVIGFFTPLVDYRSNDGRITGDASAFQMARNADNIGDLSIPAQQLWLSPEDARRLARVLHEGLNVYRGGIIAFFAPAGLLMLLGVVSLLRDRMGRLSGFVALVLGAGCCAVFGRFWLADQASHDLHASLGLGLYLLLGAGLGGALAGLGSMIVPDRGPHP